MSSQSTIEAAPRPSPERIAAGEQAGGALVVLIVACLAGMIGWLATRRRLWLAPVVASSAAAIGLMHLFRAPARQTVAVEHAVLSPGDGLVRRVDMAREERFLHGPAMRIEIQVRPQDIQVIRAPIRGVIRMRRYDSARTSPRPDDAIWLGIKGADAVRVALCETASPIWRRLPAHWARRFICLPDIGDTVQAGMIIGHLTLGGTVDVFVPATASIRVRAGQRISAGQTILAVLPST